MNVNDIGIGTVIQEGCRNFVVVDINGNNKNEDIITAIDTNGKLIIAKLVLDNCTVIRLDYITADCVDVLKAYRELRKMINAEELDIKGYITL